MDGATFQIPTLLQKATAIQIIDNHHVMIHQALAGLMARNNVPDRGKRAAIAEGTNQRELELQRGNPPSLATARNASTDRTRSSLCMLVPLLAMATTAHAFSAAPGSPNFSNFPRKQTWVAPKATPELMNDMYQVHGAAESAGTIGVFDFIGEGTRASKSPVDLKLMGLDSIVELLDGLPTTLAAYDAEGQEFPFDTTVQEIHDGGAKSLSVTPLLGLMPFYVDVEEDGAVKPFNFGTDVEEAGTDVEEAAERGPNDNNEIDNIETDDASVVRCEETADMAVPEGEHGSQPNDGSEAVGGETADMAVPEGEHGSLTQATRIGSASTQSLEAEHLEEALLNNEETKVLQLLLDVACVGAEDVRGSEETGSDAAMRSAWFPVPLLPTCTQADSILWLLIVAGGIFLKFFVGMMPSRKNAFCPNQASKRPGLSCFYATRLLFLLWLGNGALCDDPSPSLRSRKAPSLGLDQNYLEEQRLENQRQSFQQLQQEMESRFNDLANRLSALQEMESGFTEMSGQLSALKEMESGFTEMSGQLSALTSIVSSDSRNSESRNLRSNARKLQSPLSTENPVPYRRACTSHRVSQRDLYTKIIDHLDDQEDIYYNRGRHILLQFGSKYLDLGNGNAVCSSRRNPVYRVRAVNSSPEENVYSFYDPRRPGQYLYLPTDSNTVGMASSETTDAELLSLTRESHGKYYWSAPREIEFVGGEQTVILSRCQGDCDEDSHCHGDLSCFQRDESLTLENPPNCLGDTGDYPGFTKDYCYSETPKDYLTCGSDGPTWISYRSHRLFSESIEDKCPYFEKFSGDALRSMVGLDIDRTGFLRDFLEWEVGGPGGVTDLNNLEERWADGRQYSLEIKFDVDISSENYGRSKGILGSYTLNIDTGLNSFEEWDYFEVRSSEYANPGNGCSRRHSIPQITLYQCEPINDKDGGYGDRDGWSAFRLISEVGDKCLS
ncbi:hypothetical protein THAOC_31643, partial [Thalassiosira oceanica]